tara:strand:- start:793 stop:1008 length:216 start_codon:yes stop_codon:yes gene_type:complete
MNLTQINEQNWLLQSRVTYDYFDTWIGASHSNRMDLTKNLLWGHSSAGRAPAWHAGGQGFKSPWLHQLFDF